MAFESRILRCFWVFLIVAAFGAAVSCAKKPNKVESDPFFEKWKTMSETSRGSSPAPRTREIDPTSDRVVEVREDLVMPEPLTEEDAPPEKPLPSKPVTLRMKDSPVSVVLRAISRGVGQDLLINSGVQGMVSVDVNKAPWDEVFLGILNSQGLRYTWEGDIIRVMTENDIKKDLAVREIQEKTKRQKIVSKRVEPLIMKVVKIDYADPESLVAPLESIIAAASGQTSSPEKNQKKDAKASASSSARGSVQFNSQSNSLILLSVREDLERMLALIDKLDRPPRQVHIQANIVETTRNTARQLGVQWGWMYGRYNSLADDVDFFLTPGGSSGSTASRDALLNGSYTGAVGEFGDKGVSGQGMGVSFPADLSGGAGASMGLLIGKLGSNVLEMQLSALAEAGKANILSTPSITTLDNQKAVTENGRQVPYVTIDSDGEREVKFKDATLKLEITPHVIDEKLLKMKVEVKKDEVDLENNVDGNPFIYKKETKTTLILRNGETIVISGLTKSRQSDNDAGVPWLKDVPGLGRLFKSENKTEDMEEVLIFLTPTVLPMYKAPEKPSQAPEPSEQG